MNFDPPTTAIIILAFFSFFCSAFYSSCRRRRLTSRDNSRAIRAAGVDNGDNVEAAQGLERSVIESFPVFSYNLVKGLKSQAKGSECAVCLSDFEDHEMLRLLPKCSHAFHPECIDTWLCNNTTCPLCRTTLLSAADSNATTTDFSVAEAQLSDEQLTIVVDNGSGVSRQDNDFSNDEAAIGAATYDSTGQSLKQGNEWYIVTGNALTPGLYSSFAGMHQPSSSFTPPSYSKAGGSMENRSNSERWGNISINPASFLRTFSMRATAGDGTECSHGGSGSSRHAGKSAV